MKRLPESVYRDLFAYQHMGDREVTLPFGRADVVLWPRRGQPHGVVVEVEPFYSWRHGMRQALAYGAQGGRPSARRYVMDLPILKPALAVYGDISREDAVKLFEKTRGYVDLYMLRGVVWRAVTSRHKANLEHVPQDEAGIRIALKTAKAEYDAHRKNLHDSLIYFPRVA